MAIFSFISQINSSRSANATQVAAMAVRAWSSGFPRSHCAIAQHLTNLRVNSWKETSKRFICLLISVANSIRRQSSWGPKPRVKPLSPKISSCSFLQIVSKLLRRTSWLSRSWRGRSIFDFSRRLFGAWRPGCSIFDAPNTLVKSIKWLTIFSLTCSSTAGRGPFWRNQIPNVWKTTTTTANKQEKKSRMHS